MLAANPAPALSIGHDWNWKAFHGSASALKWNRRDLSSIDAILPFVKGRTVVVQAGGNLGIFPKALASQFTTVLTFEPAPDLFQMLTQNAPEPNIVKFQAALGDTPRLVGLSRERRDGKADNHEGITHVAGVGTLPMMQLDDLRLPVVDLLYLDLEGYELFALWGAEDTVLRCRPVIAVEINKGIGFYGYQREDVRQWLTDRAYRFVLRVRSDEVYVPQEQAA